MAQVTIYGASDDLIEIEGECSGCDEYNAEDAAFVLTGPNGSMRLRVWYARGGVWAIACSPTDEDAPMLSATITGAIDNGYSAQAVVDGVGLVVREASA